MAATDVLSYEDALEAIGEAGNDDDGELRRELPSFVAATTRWIDDQVGPVVSRALASSVAEATTATTVLEVTATLQQWAALRRYQRYGLQFVTVGTAASPHLDATDRTIVDVDEAAGTVTLSGDTFTVTSGSSLRAGQVTNTAGVLDETKIAAKAFLSWLWGIERGHPGSDDEDFGVSPQTPPRRIYALLGDSGTLA